MTIRTRRKRPIKDRIQRFFKKWLNITDDGCWLWTGSKNNIGYGRLGQAQKIYGERLIHRISFVYHIGPIPSGLCVCHRCDHPSCVNPEHLFLATVKDNLIDMASKRRHPTIKVKTDDDVRFIRDSDLRQDILADMFGISQPEVSHIQNRIRWEHVINE